MVEQRGRLVVRARRQGRWREQRQRGGLAVPEGGQEARLQANQLRLQLAQEEQVGQGKRQRQQPGM